MLGSSAMSATDSAENPCLNQTDSTFSTNELDVSIAETNTCNLVTQPVLETLPQYDNLEDTDWYIILYPYAYQPHIIPVPVGKKPIPGDDYSASTEDSQWSNYVVVLGNYKLSLSSSNYLIINNIIFPRSLPHRSVS